jgi:membrane protease YdiL (CAAX protease family)
MLYQLLPLRTGAAIASAILIAVCGYLVWRVAGRPLAYVRLRRLGPRTVAYSVLASLALIPVAASVMAILMSRLDIPKEWLEAAYELVRADDVAGLFYAWVVAALLAAIGEELVFRGVLQNALTSKYSPGVAILITSTVFGVLHVWRFPAAFILGAFLGTLYVMTASLLAPIIAHIAINSVVVIVSYVFEQAGPGTLPDWVESDAPAPAGILVVSVLAFVILMVLIRRACPAGDRVREASGPGSGLDGAR